MNKIEAHEYAALVPMASLDEQAALTKDIKENGLREPIVLWRGKIVDGRCRQMACNTVGERIRFKELDDSLDDNAVKAFVKSVNTRRNLTQTQKIMSACRESLDANSRKIQDVADSWGISKRILENARMIAKNRPEFIDPLFNGKSVTITDRDGNDLLSNKVSAVYSYVKKGIDNASEDNQFGWKDDGAINTQLGKEWYYEQLVEIDRIGPVKMKMLLTELANYKFRKEV